MALSTMRSVFMNDSIVIVPCEKKSDTFISLRGKKATNIAVVGVAS